MELKCPYCGSPRVKMVGGADGNPYNKNKLEKAVCHDCGMTVSTEASLEELVKAINKTEKEGA